MRKDKQKLATNDTGYAVYQPLYRAAQSGRSNLHMINGIICSSN